MDLTSLVGQSVKWDGQAWKVTSLLKTCNGEPLLGLERDYPFGRRAIAVLAEHCFKLCVWCDGQGVLPETPTDIFGPFECLRCDHGIVPLDHHVNDISTLDDRKHNTCPECDGNGDVPIGGGDETGPHFGDCPGCDGGGTYEAYKERLAFLAANPDAVPCRGGCGGFGSSDAGGYCRDCGQASDLARFGPRDYDAQSYAIAPEYTHGRAVDELPDADYYGDMPPF